jgi:hypothetical protein
MRRSRVLEWAWPYQRPADVRRDALRAIVYAGGVVALVGWLGVWGLLAGVLLIPLVWLVETVALGVSHFLGQLAKTR